MATTWPDVAIAVVSAALAAFMMWRRETEITEDGPCAPCLAADAHEPTTTDPVEDRYGIDQPS